MYHVCIMCALLLKIIRLSNSKHGPKNAHFIINKKSLGNVFLHSIEQIMHYLYTGDFSFEEKDVSNIDNLIDILRVADEEFLEDVSKSTIPI